MKRILITIILIAFPILAESQEASPHAFVIELVGEHTFSDVEVIRKGCIGSPLASDTRIVRSARGVTSLAGTWRGTIETLRADLQSLAADRFTIEGEHERHDVFLFTLRKLSPPPPSPLPQ